VRESRPLRGGYSYNSNPVTQRNPYAVDCCHHADAIATGAGWTQGRFRYDATTRHNSHRLNP
jgi:hypothetical protein